LSSRAQATQSASAAFAAASLLGAPRLAAKARASGKRRLGSVSSARVHAGESEIPDFAFQHLAALGPASALFRCPRRAGDPEVAEFDVAVEREIDVRGRHVAVRDVERLAPAVVGRMHGVERLRDRARDVDRYLRRKRPIVAGGQTQQAVQVDTRHVLHRQVRLVAHHACAEHGHHVGVVHGAMQLRLATQRFEVVRLAARFRQAFDHELRRRLQALPRSREEYLRAAPHGDATLQHERAKR
jgi:hypothetical protein